MLADIPSIFYWWVILFSLGLFSFPLTWSLLRKFFDSGYGLSKIFGITVPSYLVFLFSTLHILPLNQLSIFGIFAIYIILNFIIYAKNNTEIKEIFRKKLKIFIQ